MIHLEIDGERYTISQAELVIGSDPSVGLPLTGRGVAPRHAIVQQLPDGQVIIRLAREGLPVLVNGVSLGAQPTPLLHGDKVAIAGYEMQVVDEREGGRTRYVQAVDPGALAAVKPGAKRQPAGTTGGRLVSLTDGREYRIIGTSLVIGRDAACDVVLTSKSVSRRHAEILATPRGYVLEDSSTNGTFVNGARVQGQPQLARGDVIQCGEHEFRFYADVAPAPPGPPPEAAVPTRPEPVEAMPPPGAEYRLAETLHGLPVTPRPAAPAKPVAEQPAGVPKVLANLVVRSGELKGQRFPIRVPIVNVGRAEYNDIVLPDATVSTQHAKLQRREGIWVLVDLESSNGTFVDGERVSGEVPLAPGALIRFGEVQTLFEPTDDTIDAQKGGSTRLLSAIRLPDPGTEPKSQDTS